MADGYWLGLGGLSLGLGNANDPLAFTADWRVRYGTGMSAIYTGDTGIPQWFEGQTITRPFNHLYALYPLGFSGDPFNGMTRRPPWPGAAGGQATGPLVTTQLGIALPVDGVYEAGFWNAYAIGYVDSNVSWSNGTLDGHIYRNGVAILTFIESIAAGSGTGILGAYPEPSPGISAGTWVRFNGKAGDFITMDLVNHLAVIENTPDPNRPTGLVSYDHIFWVLQLYNNAEDPATPAIALTTAAVLEEAITYDEAVLSSGVHPRGGTITYELYDQDDPTCAGPPIHTYVRTIAGALGPYGSTPFTLVTPGTYHWKATYSGDHWNSALETDCDDEAEQVTWGAVFPGLTRLLAADASTIWFREDF